MKQAVADKKIHKIALLVAISCVMQITESLIPHPIPGLRLGLANIVVLAALVTLGFRPAIEIAVLRTILSAFIMGTFMSPTFILSFFGALISALVMGGLYFLSKTGKGLKLSIIGISIIGALVHNIAQLYLAYLILIRHSGIFVFFGWMCIGSVIMGWVTGAAAGAVCVKLRMLKAGPAYFQITQGRSFQELSDPYVNGKSCVHLLPGEVKIGAMIILSIAVLIFSSYRVYAGLFLSLLMFIFLSGIPFMGIALKIKKYAALILASFLLPLFFNSDVNVLYQIGYFKITYLGLKTGALFSLRILFLLASSALLVSTTSAEKMTLGFSRILYPLRFAGISRKRIANILSIAWLTVPLFFDITRKSIKRIDFKKVKNLSDLIEPLSDLIAGLYLQTEQTSADQMSGLADSTAE